jgi:ethanolamine utilization protein EutA (predicted chaperonin)
MAILRALADDVLAKAPDLAIDIAGRGAKLNELSKAKRTAVV